MPVPVMAEIFYGGLHSVPWAASALKIAPYAAALYILRWYFSGARNSHERIMSSKVVMVTGGTSGIGESLVYSLATRGAQIILLVKDISDPFLIDRINFLREHTNNQLIYAEQCDLSSLHSVRLFATKWIDNAPPRRLDLILLCASHSPPPFSPQQFTHDGADKVWGINYLANFHLLTLLAPAIRNQPPDRDVRVITATCGSYMLSPPLAQHIPDPALISRGGFPRSKPWQATGAAKLALMSFLLAFNAQNRAYIRKDKELVNARTFIVDPGFARTPSTRSFLTLGSLWGLMVYFLTYPLWWLVLKSPKQAGESFLYAAMSPEGAEGEGGVFYRECRRGEVRRDEVYDAELAKTLWEATEKEIVELEKKGAVERKRRKMEEEREAKKNGKKNAQDGDKGKGKGVAVGVGGAGQRIEEIIEEVEGANSGTTASGSENLKTKAARSRKG